MCSMCHDRSITQIESITSNRVHCTNVLKTRVKIMRWQLYSLDRHNACGKRVLLLCWLQTVIVGRMDCHRELANSNLLLWPQAVRRAVLSPILTNTCAIPSKTLARSLLCVKPILFHGIGVKHRCSPGRVMVGSIPTGVTTTIMWAQLVVRQ